MDAKLLLRLGGMFALVVVPLHTFAEDLPFTGKWTSTEIVEGQSRPYSTFTINLNEDGAGNIHGEYCFVTQNGNRIDCNPGNEFNISGKVENGKSVAVVSFYSFFGAMGGVAKITANDSWLIWDVITPPKGGDYYGPLRIKMHKDVSAETRVGERMVVVDKAFLYDTPSRSQVSRVYVIKGDWVKLLNVSSDLQFWKIEFVSNNKRHITKWINCADINFCAK
ncbi:hypothetical protein [Burkholderia territorii]|uniref:hypothetical protein n=1 Tax=Burkholderia territorii TaxID=1503055 RepID=UPI000AAA6789|nr:hypothetical protein [Burkholderia territorii]TXG02617.1 hypothetical protein FU139_32320 [Burkholderia territorii]HDR8868199.1 hypothetical protein [Burkholderia territorii]HDR8874338.1 hypothetical protein [Burkholderia territorii]HDR8880542.1 hypothetical protein [Burkholderia territorii]HDR8886789.1 hypothetical protein [Burkholderia territorii]